MPDITFPALSAPTYIYTIVREIMVALVPGKNLLANPSFEVWQRGAGGAASIAKAASTPGYTADRWYYGNGANQASTIAQVAGLSDQSQWAAKVQRNNLETGTGVLTFEYPFTLAQIMAARGKVLALQVMLKAGANFSAASSNLVVKLYCGTGAAAKRVLSAYTSETAPISATQAITTTATKYNFVSTAVPTTTAQMSLQFSFTPVGTAGADDSFTIDDVQLEIGSVSTAYDLTGWDFDMQLRKCQRFYRKSFPYATAPVQSGGVTGGVNVQTPTGATGTIGAQVSFDAPMYKVPTVVTYNPSANNANVRDVTNNADRTITVGTISESGFPITFAAASAAAAHCFHWAADAEL